VPIADITDFRMQLFRVAMGLPGDSPAQSHLNDGYGSEPQLYVPLVGHVPMPPTCADSMRYENEPDEAANNQGHSEENNYFLQYFHIFLLVSITRFATTIRPHP